MYAGHLAAALTIKAVVPRAPMAPLVMLVFLPDLLWLGLSVGGIETDTRAAWFDGWSHSFASILLQTAIVGACWWHSDMRAAIALSSAVLSHLLLDLPVHPAALEWFPHAGGGFGNFLHGWAGVEGALGKSHGWWVEAALVLCGGGLYIARARRIGIRTAAAAAVALLVASLHISFD